MSNRILVVEDSPTQALRMQTLLEEAGYHVEIAKNGQIGLDKALSQPPDLVVADILMPVMDGYEMTRLLKADPRTAAVPILMVTIKDQPLDIVRGLEMGADHFITKPYEDNYLLQRVRALFDWVEKAKAGHLPEQQQLQRFEHEIVITKSREQVLQTLFRAMARVVGCQAMTLLVRHSNDGRSLFAMSFQPLDASTVQMLNWRMEAIFSRVAMGLTGTLPTDAVEVVTGPREPSIEDEACMERSEGADLLAAFLYVPLAVDGEVTGLVGVFSPRPGAFDIEHVRFLFDMGQKAAQALSRLRAE